MKFRSLSDDEGVLGRLSDRSAFHQRLRSGCRSDLLPRLAHCFLAERSRGGAAAGDAASGLLLPAAGWRELSRPRGERRQEDRQRSAGAEARVARDLSGEVQRSKRAMRARRRALERSGAERDRASARIWKLAVAAAERRRKTRWRWITSTASWPRSSRARSRDCRWRAWSWSGLRQEGGRSQRTAGARSAGAG